MKNDLQTLPIVSSQCEKFLWTKWETRRWCVTLFFGAMVLYAARGALPICAAAMSFEYGWSKQDTGTVLSCFFWGYVSTQVIAGWLADRFGGDVLLTSAALIWGILTFLTPYVFEFANTIPWLSMPIVVAFRVFFGLCQGFHFPATASLISRSTNGPEKGKMFGFVMAGSHAGTVLCGSLGSIIVDRFGPNSLFYVIGILAVIWWLYARHLMSTAKWREKLEDTVDTFSLLVKPVTNGDVNSSGLRNTPYFSVPWLNLLRKAHFWAAFCAHYCGAYAYFTLFSWMPSYFTENWPLAPKWMYNFLPNLAVMITSIVAPWIANKLIAHRMSPTNARKLMEFISLVGMALCLYLVADVEDYHLALLFLSLAMALRGFHHGGVVVTPQEFAPNHAGAAYGLLNVASAIPGFIGVYVAGYILETSRDWTPVFNLTSVLCVLGAFVYVIGGTAKPII